MYDEFINSPTKHLEGSTVIDLKQLRENPEQFQTRLASRGGSYDLQTILDLDRQQREIEAKRSQLQARSNEIGKQVGQKMKSGVKDDPEIQAPARRRQPGESPVGGARAAGKRAEGSPP